MAASFLPCFFGGVGGRHDVLTFALEAQAVNVKGTFFKGVKKLDVINKIMKGFMWKKSYS